jgi:hypothetical protein
MRRKFRKYIEKLKIADERTKKEWKEKQRNKLSNILIQIVIRKGILSKFELVRDESGLELMKLMM